MRVLAGSHYAVFGPGMSPAGFKFFEGSVNREVDLFWLEYGVDRLKYGQNVRVRVTKSCDFEIVTIYIKYLDSVDPDMTFS